MAGTKEGGIKAAAANKERHGADFYQKIGSKGGKNGTTGGFAARVPCNCSEYPFEHLIRECAGKRGGSTSRRGSRKAAYGK